MERAPRDLLVKLYELPDVDRSALVDQGVDVRRAMAFERHVVLDWIAATFERGWASEAAVAYANRPISCFLAVAADVPLGFACHDATALGFFGPTGVAPSARGRGIGRALLLVTLLAMRELGYAYAIIGSAGPVGFYAEAVGATVIPGSWPGIYRGRLRDPSGPS